MILTHRSRINEQAADLIERLWQRIATVGRKACSELYWPKGCPLTIKQLREYERALIAAMAKGDAHERQKRTMQRRQWINDNLGGTSGVLYRCIKPKPVVVCPAVRLQGFAFTVNNLEVLDHATGQWASVFRRSDTAPGLYPLVDSILNEYQAEIADSKTTMQLPTLRGFHLQAQVARRKPHTAGGVDGW